MKKAYKTAKKQYHNLLFYNDIGSSGRFLRLSVGETSALALSVGFLTEGIW
jgi:hypothetical protein